MYVLRMISAVLHDRRGPAVSEAALDLRPAELTILVPLVAILLVPVGVAGGDQRPRFARAPTRVTSAAVADLGKLANGSRHRNRRRQGSSQTLRSDGSKP